MRPRAALLLALAACQAAPTSATTTSAPPSGRPAPHELGRLGRPMGTWLHLEGVRETRGKVGPGSLLVDRVDGAGLPTPIPISLANLDLPEGVRCAIAGYETGRWIGIPPEVVAAEQLGPTQAGWQFAHEFVVTSVQAPPELVRAALDRGIGRR